VQGTPGRAGARSRLPRSMRPAACGRRPRSVPGLARGRPGRGPGRRL